MTCKRPESRLPGFVLVCSVAAVLWGGYSVAAQESPEVTVELSREELRYLERLGPITVAPDPDWIPFEHVDEEGNFTGIAADLLELVARRLGITFTYVFPRDWDEALELSQAGEVLILPFLNQTPAREEWLVFTEPLLVDPNVFVTREEHPFISDALQLTDETIVFPSGTSMEERVRRDFPNLEIVTVPSENEVFQAVVNREADMTLRSLAIAAYTIRKEGLFNLKIAGQAPDEYTNRLRMGVLRSEPMLRDILNRGIETITPREREEILNRHINVTIVTPMDYGFIIRTAVVLAALIGISFYWNLRLKRINAALSESERSKSVLLATLPGIAYRCRDDENWTMEFISEGCRDLTGYRSDELQLNRVVSYNELIHPEDRGWTRARWEEARTTGELVKLEYRIRTADGLEKWVFEQGLFLYDEEGRSEGIEGLVIDISDRKHAEAELYRVSIHDHLTGLYNRAHLAERLLQLSEEFHRGGREFFLCILDLDHFKSINDTYGHAAGDLVLREFARLLRESFRPYDLVGRFGGEEFVVVVLNSAVVEAEQMFRRLQETIRKHDFRFEGGTIGMTFSGGLAGAAEFETHQDRQIWVDTMLRTADDRLYAAKSAGRDRLVFPLSTVS